MSDKSQSDFAKAASSDPWRIGTATRSRLSAPALALGLTLSLTIFAVACGDSDGDASTTAEATSDSAGSAGTEATQTADTGDAAGAEEASGEPGEPTTDSESDSADQTEEADLAEGTDGDTAAGTADESDTSETDAEQAADTGELFPDVLDATLSPEGDGSYTVAVTLSSPYDSPERYADAWRVSDLEGNELGIRVLTHDHANEQPFTRSQSGIAIPEDVDTVLIEGRDQISGWGGASIEVPVPTT